MMLEIEAIHTYYGNIHALKGVSLTVAEGEIVALIGGNGAGKTTTLNTISGLLQPRQGHIRLQGEEMLAYRPHHIVAKGVVQVLENLELGAYTCRDSRRLATNLERVFTLFPRLQDRRHQLAGTLSGGEQQMLAMGRALMANPRVLLLDEPSMGLAPILVDDIFATIVQLHAAGTTILLVEQNARMALQIANRGYVLQSGVVVLSDTAERLRANELVRKAYLGVV
jgi:branched-chain amino acid transport system ATP-binding protein